MVSSEKDSDATVISNLADAAAAEVAVATGLSSRGHSDFGQKTRRCPCGITAVHTCQKPSGQAYLPQSTRRQQSCCPAEKVVCHCREYSRQAYLEKREEKKITELEADLQDAEMLFAGEKLSKRETADIAHKRELLSLAMQRKQAQEELNRDDGYHMPTAYDRDGAAPTERYKVLTERYRCVCIRMLMCMCACMYQTFCEKPCVSHWIVWWTSSTLFLVAQRTAISGHSIWTFCSTVVLLQTLCLGSMAQHHRRVGRTGIRHKE